MSGGSDADRVVVALRVPVADAELAADELFGLGASAVGEEAVDDGVLVELVADLPAARVPELTRDHRVVESKGSAVPSLHDPVRVAGFELRPVDPAAGGPSTPGDGPADDRTVWLRSDVAFGSGTHATTRLCVAATVDLVGPGARVVDVGSGNGVLSVVAARCGAASVVALDVDPAARAETGAAAQRNGVAGVVSVTDAGVDELARTVGPVADVLLANVLVGVVEDHAAALVDLVSPGGALVVSGVLASQVGRTVDAVRTAAAAATRPAWVRSASAEGDWRAVVFRLGHGPVTAR